MGTVHDMEQGYENVHEKDRKIVLKALSLLLLSLARARNTQHAAEFIRNKFVYILVDLRLCDNEVTTSHFSVT